MQPVDRTRQLDLLDPREQVLVDDEHLEPREMRTQTEMLAGA